MSDPRAIALRAIGLLDLTNLEAECTDEDVDALCDAAFTPHGSVAAICIWPRFVSRARERLKGTDVRIATVAAFPGGGEPVDDVVADARRAAFDGAHEIDLVLDYHALAEGENERVFQTVSAVKDALPDGTLLKVILETGVLQVSELIRIASVGALKSGADFIKTSTGKVPVNATPDAAQIMIDAIHDVKPEAGFKAAGGIRTVEDAATYLAIADRVMGPDWASAKTFRFGASSLMKNLVATVEGTENATESGSY
ncbi:MAG: deoxyribose-phosphate aldolase [Pseudomonadota bacterium]